MSSNFTIRKDINNLTSSELANLRLAFKRIQDLPKNDNRSYQYFAGLHDYPGRYCKHYPETIQGYPDVDLFFPWHRAYLYKIEKSLQEQVAGVTIPYWDWRTDNPNNQVIPKAFSDPADDQNNPNPLYHYRIVYPEINLDRYTERFPGTVPSLGPLPTTTQIDAILSDPKDDVFTEFSNNVNFGPHGHVHLWTGGIGKWADGKRRNGDMYQTTYAAFDPIFWSHHCMIDKLWWTWQRSKGVKNIPNEWMDMVLDPFEMKVSDVLDIFQLGYDYGTDGATSAGNWSGING